MIQHGVYATAVADGVSSHGIREFMSATDGDISFHPLDVAEAISCQSERKRLLDVTHSTVVPAGMFRGGEDVYSCCE